ncbi:uncharacterized protein LOC111400539 [Olea europaea var. sylvestris]|uniref:uncharacterized protein LOC111400539 n=1 Tax=Olea europaea var. sylvestris TaxID=158386 RepID=UPI000C1CF6C1|nr:uncharacterized protein LOC111400539 [Olea europaea var. sylvestris]
MLGRVRPSSINSLGLLELERPNSKIIKDDSLSIYERTLLKLKQGSLRNPSIAVENSMGTDVNCTIASDSTEQEAMTIEGNFSSIDSLPVSSNCESTGTSKEQGTKSLSILCLFSRYKDSQQLSVSSSDD